MTRKRFIKLLMANGYTRNEANHIARTGKKGQPYDERHALICLTSNMPDEFAELRERLQTACRTIADAAKRATKRLAETFSAIAAGIGSAMPGIIENMNRLQEAAEGTPPSL